MKVFERNMQKVTYCNLQC